jgi:hypothetical protein
MKRLYLPAFAALAALLTMVSIFAGGAFSASSSSACAVKFEATVHRGPDAGLSFIGALALRVSSSGSATGTLTPQSGAPVTAVGQVQGRAISFVLDLPKGQHLFGVGVAQNLISACRGAIGGALTGPRPGDSGDWGYALGG